MKTLPFESHLYDRARHEPFVLSAWVEGARRPREDLRYLLRRPDVRCLVASIEGYPDDLLGWVAVQYTSAPAVIWSYTRATPGVRRRGLMTSLLARLGVDISMPTPCLNWSRDAAAIAAKPEYRPFYAPPTKERGAAA